MFQQKKLKDWADSYWNQIKRNIGIITINQQEMIRKTKIAIFGVGGLGGPLTEQLIRSGSENIVICDNDKFEESNLNRQTCTRNDLGDFKVDKVEKFITLINPNIIINKFYEINENNIDLILKDVKIAALTLDDPLVSILISRECLKREIPLIESYAVPCLFSWWFTTDSINYEAFYKLPTESMSYKEILESPKIQKQIRETILAKLVKFPNIKDFYVREGNLLDAMLSGDYPLVSLAPIVRISASYLAFEIIFSGILNTKHKILAPKIIGFDYIKMQVFKL